MTTTAEKLVPIREIATEYGVTTETVGNWCRRGHIPYVMLGDWYFVDPEEVRAIVSTWTPTPPRSPRVR